MTRPSRALTMSAAFVLALIPAGFAASSALADEQAAVPAVAPAFEADDLADVQLSPVGSGATLNLTVDEDGEVEVEDEFDDEEDVELPESEGDDGDEGDDSDDSDDSDTDDNDDSDTDDNETNDNEVEDVEETDEVETADTDDGVEDDTDSDTDADEGSDD